MLEFLKNLSLPGIFLFFLGANFGSFVTSITSCWLLGVIFKKRRIFSRWETLKASEQLAAFGAVVLNSVVSILGWTAWKADYIDIRTADLGRAVLDCILMLIVLHPVEAMGFGGLIILFLTVYPMSLVGLLAYLTLNIAFGTLGHSGVEPFPAWFNITSILPIIMDFTPNME